jgi:hypothetical protein
MHNGSRAFPQQMQRLSGSAGSQRHDQCGQQRAHDHECADDLPSFVLHVGRQRKHVLVDGILKATRLHARL